MNTLSQRLLLAMKGPPEITQAELARACGIKPPSVSGWISGATKSLTGKNLIAAAKKLNVNPDWLQSNRGPMRPYGIDALSEPIDIKTDEDPPDDDDVLVEVVDIELAAGDGTDGVEFVETKSSHTYKRGFLRKLGIYDPSKIKRCKVRGDSMQPVLYHGDKVSINTGDNTIVDDGIYAIVVADQLRVKRLRRMRDGGLIIISDNKEQWPEEIIPPNELETVRVIGRVFDKSGRGGLGF